MANVVEITLRGIDEATRVFEDVGKAAERSMSDVNDSVSSVDDSINSVSDLNIDTSGAESAMSNTSDSISGVQDSLQETEQAGKSFGDRMKETFDGVADKWKEITAVAGTAGLAFETMGSKQKGLTEQTERVAQAMGTTQDEIRDAALEITNVTFPIEDALDLMETGRQQGIESTEQLKEYATFWDMVGDATGLAGPELGKASTGLRAVGIAAGDEKEALAAFGYITENTSSQVDDFLQFLDRAGPQLNEMGMNVDDAAAVLGILEHEFGMSGRTARQEFRKAVNEADGDMNVLMETLGVSDELFEQYRDTVADSSDVIERNADIHADSYTAMDKLQQISSELMYQYGDFIGVLSSLAPLLMSLGPIIKGVQGATALFNATLWASPITWIVAGIVALIAIIVLLWKNWDEVSQFLATSWEWIKEVASNVFGWIGEFLSATWEWIKEMSIAVWQSIKEFFSGLWTSIQEIFTSVVNSISEFLSSTWEFITNTVQTVWNGIKAFFGLVWQGIVTVVQTYINMVQTVITTVFNVIKTVITTIWNTIKTVTSTVWNTIVSIVTGLINGFKNTISSVFNAIKSVITTIWNTIKSVSTSVWNGIISVITGIINRLRSGISNVFNTIKSIITTVWNAVKSVSSSVWNGIRSSISSIINGIRSTISSVFNGIRSTISSVWNGIKSTTSSVWNSMIGIVKAPINSIIGLINGMINALNSISIKLPKVPDWVPGIGGKGGGTIGFNIPNVPALATGGVVSEPTLAIVGDAGRGNPEIVAPQKMLSEIMAQEFAKVLKGIKPEPSTGDSGEPKEIIVPVYLDGREIARVTAPHMDRELGKRRHNKTRAEGGW